MSKTEFDSNLKCNLKSRIIADRESAIVFSLFLLLIFSVFSDGFSIVSTSSSKISPNSSSNFFWILSSFQATHYFFHPFRHFYLHSSRSFLRIKWPNCFGSGLFSSIPVISFFHFGHCRLKILITEITPH